MRFMQKENANYPALWAVCVCLNTLHPTDKHSVTLPKNALCVYANVYKINQKRKKNREKSFSYIYTDTTRQQNVYPGITTKNILHLVKRFGSFGIRTRMALRLFAVSQLPAFAPCYSRPVHIPPPNLQPPACTAQGAGNTSCPVSAKCSRRAKRSVMPAI